MKKLLLFVFLLSGFIAKSQNLNVNGNIIKTDPVFTNCTLTVVSRANNNISFNHSFYGDFLVIGPGNTMSTGSYSIASLTRGAILSSSTTGVNALETDHGLNRFNVYDGRSLFGQNVTDDGFTLVQVHGSLKTDSLRVGTAGATGDVLTKQANGTYQPQTPSGGGGATSGSYTPTFTPNFQVTSVILSSATWIRVGNIVTVSVSGAVTPYVNVIGGSFKCSLPFITSSTMTGSGNGTVVGTPQYYDGLMSVAASQTTGTFAFTIDSNPTAYQRVFSFTVQYVTP